MCLESIEKALKFTPTRPADPEEFVKQMCHGQIWGQIQQKCSFLKKKKCHPFNPVKFEFNVKNNVYKMNIPSCVSFKIQSLTASIT